MDVIRIEFDSAFLSFICGGVDKYENQRKDMKRCLQVKHYLVAVLF